MAPRHHVIIAGTGRTGTTFLVQLLTNLGLDTGFEPGEFKLFENCNAGLENDIMDPEAPYVVKSPALYEVIDEIIDRDDIVIDHALVPMRDLVAAAESRRAVWSDEEAERFYPGVVPGGLWGTDDPAKQEEVLLQGVYTLMLALSGSAIPVTLLSYPRLTKDLSYLFAKLAPVLGDTTRERFETVFRETVDPGAVSQYTPDDQ